MNAQNLELFWYWIRERERIRLRKEAGVPKPWTGDPILATYHFCNVHREDDRGTKEIRQYVRENNYFGDSLPVTYTIARMFNNVHALYLLNKYGWLELKLRQMAGEKIFHTAYVVSTCGKSMNKVDYVLSVADAVAALSVPSRGLSAAHQELMKVDGLGSFLAAQVVADLRNDRYLRPLDDNEAKYWSAPGPGSIKGLKYIFGGCTAAAYHALVANLYRVMPDDINAMNIHAQDLQNCLCEFSKYMRHLNKEAGRKRYYDR